MVSLLVSLESIRRCTHKISRCGGLLTGTQRIKFTSYSHVILSISLKKDDFLTKSVFGRWRWWGGLAIGRRVCVQFGVSFVLENNLHLYNVNKSLV